jgi:chromatin segregation and condensation protein Rec8/ScpA/Scc1 (kleisin family)
MRTVATFLALLALVRHGVLEARQATAFAPLELRRGSGDPRDLPQGNGLD